MGNRFSKKKMEKIDPGTVTLVGMGWDEHSTFMKGPARAPKRIRKVMHNGSSNLCTENGIDLARESRFTDLGDLTIGTASSPLDHITDTVSKLLDHGAYVLTMGGDHAITYPIIRAYNGRYEQLNILHLDAHPDLYEAYEGNPYSHACPFARIMESGYADRLIQVGIRTMTPHQKEQADKYNVEVIQTKRWHRHINLKLNGPVYISLDMDVLDPAFAPGVSHHEPGGLTTREVIRIIQNLRVPIVGADIVELNPDRDVNDVTAMTCVKLIKEIAGAMLQHNVLEL